MAAVPYTLILRDLGGKVVREVTYTPSTASWAWRKDYIWRDGQLLATVSASEGLRHAHLDHLGSPRLLTDRCGERLASWQLWPFGVDPQGQPAGGGQHPERMRFTGHERDLHLADRASDDLDYMHARYYSPLLARFLSVDPGRDNDLRAPQSWNLYAYVRNNPLNLSDPTGQWSLGQFLFDVLSGRLFEEWFKKKVDEQTKPTTQRTKEEQEEEKQLLREAGLDPSNQGAVLGTGGRQIANAARGAIKNVGGPIAGQVGATAVAAGAAMTVRVASTAFGRSVASLREFISTGTGTWQRTSVHVEPAAGRAYRGAVSMEEVFVNTATGERIVRHTIVRGSEVLHETFRVTAKFGAK